MSKGFEAKVEHSHRVAVGAKFLGPTNSRGARIKVQRCDHQTGDPTMTVEWDHALNLDENYTKAISAYLAKMDWCGSWSVAQTTNGAVAVMVAQ